MRKLLLVALTCSWVLSGIVFAAPATVNHWRTLSAGNATTSTISVTPAATDEVIVAVNYSTSSTVAISDNLGTITWHVALAPSSGSGSAYIAVYYAENIPSGLTSITLTFGTATYSSTFVDEVSGLATSSSLDTVSTIKGAYSATQTSNPVTPAASGEYAFAFVGDAGYPVTYSSWTGGFTQQDTQGTPSAAWADQVAGSSAVTAGVTTSTSTNGSIVVALFKPASGGSSCTNAGLSKAGSFSIPSAGTTVMRLKSGNVGTVDCAGTNYRLKNGNFGVN